ncbi:MAG: hypothetical protein Q9163_002389 [Psora crenata]
MDTRYERVALAPLPEKKGPSVSVKSLFIASPRSPVLPLTKSRPKSWPWHLLSHLLSFLWLAPISALLVLNFKQHVIGPSVWCPRGKCASDAFEENAVARAAKLDRADHNILGALQFVAKALEVWFMLIATALLYDLTMILARTKGGVPVGYILSHIEFGDIRNLFSPLMWTSPFPNANASTSQKHRKSISQLCFFAILAAFLTILTNLMGPATAVLVLPTLQWVTTPRHATQIYQGIALGESPQAEPAFLSSCNASDLDVGNFSCTYATQGASLDQWAATAHLTTVQYEQTYGIPILGTSQESAVLFSLNTTAKGNIFWTPSRQVLRELSRDYLNLADGKGMTQLNDSLQVVLNREGPSIGVQPACYAGNVSVTDVDEGKQVHCFSGWTIDYVHNYTKFWIGNLNSVKANATSVDVYFSDMATYYNSEQDFNSGIESCLSNDTAPECDWDSIFQSDLPNDFKNSSRNVGLISYALANDDEMVPPLPGSQARIFCDYVAYVSFPTYNLDTLPSTNILNLVRMEGFQMDPQAMPLVIHPDWFLAGWSVDRNGTVDSTREIAQRLSDILPLTWHDQEGYAAAEFIFLHAYSLGQTISMVNYDYINATAGSPASKDAARVLHAWATRHVWAYSIKGSRTSKLGVAVVCCGALCVMLRAALGLFLGKREHSPAELLVAALDHQPTSEFASMVDERDMAKVRYVIDEDPDGKPRFVPERQYTGQLGR